MRHGVVRGYDPPAGVDVATLSYDYAANARVGEHAHGSAQVIYAVSGVMEVSIGLNRWLVPPHFAIYVPAGVEHSIRMSGFVSMRTIYIRPSLVRTLGAECRVIHVSALLRELMLEAVRQGRLRRSVRLERGLRDLILAQLRTAPLAPMMLPMPSEARAAAVAEAALAVSGRDLSLEQICHEAGAGVRTVQRSFLRDTGMTFATWRGQTRLALAIEGLVGGASVKECADRAGFGHPSAFIAMFRRTLGVTPRVWARRYRAGSS